MEAMKNGGGKGGNQLEMEKYLVYGDGEKVEIYGDSRWLCSLLIAAVAVLCKY